MDKVSLRRGLIKQREALNDVSLELLNDLYSSNLLKKVNTVGLYYPLPHEINVLDIMDKYNLKFAFPKTIGNDIRFYLVDKNTPFIEGKFHVMEPSTDNIIDRDDIDLFIIPCVGISKDNQRIGYGKGYYDRYLKDYKGIKVALNYKELSSLDIKLEKHDITIDYVFVR